MYIYSTSKMHICIHMLTIWSANSGKQAQIAQTAPLPLRAFKRKPLLRDGVTILPTRITDVSTRNTAFPRKISRDLLRRSAAFFDQDECVLAFSRRGQSMTVWLAGRLAR